ncbi:ubiquitin carboxyl-terminal hydrolase 14 isoform X2 [Elaeis guineensis]|uniref:Ubiquitin carboxyl-terminal hydrolase n=1 Tax=Elaeis guineensis var. tenera TaxID=51953 RepID=A0A8N4EYV0_ELAGV|nr:ubiquitin carboxyl-terminal hydrolase 14 isoform X2 [Elaeis guineensis]
MIPSSMELLRSHLSKVRIPEPTNRISKQECCISFDTPRSEGGLYVDLSSFLAFGKEYVGWNYEKTGNPVFLHIQQRRKPVTEDRPVKKPTLLAIGVEGGFDDREPEYEETLDIVILPEHVTIPFPSVELPEKVRIAVDAILISEGAERKEQLASWTAEKKKVSAYAMNLQQINNGIVVPPSGWKCSKCDKTDNLWLNLTDGMILCGRRNWDGSGGNNHAIEHYKETNYPLAAKLGTITADLEGADVFSYPEDDSVEDPLLAQHLAFFGIDFSSLQKTEMTTAERELDQNTNFDWNRIQESGQEVELLFGPGYTGLVNLGNSCYMASVMQVVFSTHSFISRYYEKQSLKMTFEMAPADPTLDLNTQLTKLAYGLLSGKYSLPAQEKQEGIPPRMFKTVIAANHPEFSSMRQQDALEFFQHLLDQVERANAAKPELDPTRSFKFIIEERLQCPSGKVAYNKRTDNIISLIIPLHEATNKEQLEAFHKMKAERNLEGKEIASDEIIRPRVPLEACLASFSAPEEVHGFYSTALNAKTTAIKAVFWSSLMLLLHCIGACVGLITNFPIITFSGAPEKNCQGAVIHLISVILQGDVKTAGLTTFPDYLVLHMRKFVMEEGWVPKKLDVYIDVPDIIDITHIRSKGLQPGEELLPDTDSSGEKMEPTHLAANEDIVSILSGMGFNCLHCQKAAINTSNSGVEEAMNWLLSHMNDPDIDDPISNDSQIVELMSIDEASVETLISFGFQEEVARKALKASGGNIEKATDWIFNHPEVSSAVHMNATSSSMQAGDPGVPDGSGRYKLMALVSHIGTSTQCGHYVAHVYKDGRWVIFNDSKVGASVDPPKDMGYLYFFERIDS